MRKATIALLLLLLVLLRPGRVLAQSAAGDVRVTPPSSPPVDDPLLAPVPPARRVLSTWGDAVASVHSRSTDLRIALDQVRQAEARTRIALAQYLPFVDAAGSYTHQFVTHSSASPVTVWTGTGFTTSFTAPIRDTFAGSVELRQAVVDVAALDQWAIDRLGEQTGKLSVADTNRTLLLGLADQIVAVVTAERSAEINRVGLRRALEELDIVKRIQALGAATAIDVVRSEENASDARATLVAGDEVLRESRESLGLALGTPEETAVSHELNVAGIAEDAMTYCRPVASIDDRSDVAAAHENLEVAKRNLRNVYYGFLPTVSAETAVGATSVVPTGYPNPTWSVQGLLSIPLWDGGARYGDLANDRAAEDIAAQRLESLQRQDIIEVEQAQRRLSVAEQSSKVATEQRDLTAKNDDLTRNAYIAGQGTSLELVTAAEARRAAELNLALKDFDVVRARLQAVLALASCPP